MKKQKQGHLDHDILNFLFHLSVPGKLPKGIGVLNPFQHEGIRQTVTSFYQKFYHDNHQRFLILGINPGRLGAGATGIPFTDTKRLEAICGIQNPGFSTHEPSSVFVYNMIEAFGGPEKFYRDFYVSSVCPLGFVKEENNKIVNYNYYDSALLTKAIKPFAVACIHEQLKFNLNRDVVFVFGTGKNANFVRALNEEYRFFKEVVPLEHPRYIMQYKSKSMQFYIDRYLAAFASFAGQ